MPLLKLFFSNYTLESAVFSIVVNGINSLHNGSAVLFNLTHRSVCYAFLYLIMLNNIPYMQPNEDEAPTCGFYDLTE